jgi:hypothetical protein
VESGGTVAHAIGDLGGAEAAGGGERVGRFEQAGLAGPVAAEQQVRAGPGPPDERLQVAEIFGGELSEQLRSSSA